MQPRWVGSLAFAAAALCCFGVDAKPGGTFRQLQKACDTLLDPDLELGDSAAALSACAAYVQDEQPSAREVAALAARARRLGMAGNTEAADFALSAALTQLSRRGSILEGVRRVDQTGTVEPTECLPIWRTIEHDRQMAQTDGEEAEESRIRLNALANDWRRDHGRLRALGSNAAATEASRDAILDHISAVSRATDCDSSMVTLGDGSWFDVATLSSDTRFRQGALNAPLHGWFLTTMHIFVPEQLQDLCERAPADGRALGAQAESSSPGPSAVLCRLADGEAGGAGRRLFESPQHHADAVEAAFAHARQLSLKALSNKDRTRGQRTRVMFAVDFEDQQWTPSADEVIRVFKRGARETQAKYDLMSYGAWQGSETVLPTIYRVVNATFAEVRAAASAAMLRSVGEWIVQNHPDPSKRVRLSDWDHQSITFPDINTFSWAGLAQAPGSFGELLDSACTWQWRLLCCKRRGACGPSCRDCSRSVGSARACLARSLAPGGLPRGCLRRDPRERPQPRLASRGLPDQWLWQPERQHGVLQARSLVHAAQGRAALDPPGSHRGGGAVGRIAQVSSLLEGRLVCGLAARRGRASSRLRVVPGLGCHERSASWRRQ